MDSSINWSLISQIPPDITFKFANFGAGGDEAGVSGGGVHGGVSAHKMVLAMASDVFMNMFYTNNTVDMSMKEITTEDTTEAAFRVMIDALYGTSSIKESLADKSLREVFTVLRLVKKYNLPNLVLAAKECISAFIIDEYSVLDIAHEAFEFSTSCKDESQNLLDECINFVKTEMNLESFLHILADNGDRMMAAHKLAILFRDISRSSCSNCNINPCHCSVEDENEEVVNNNSLKSGQNLENSAKWKETNNVDGFSEKGVVNSSSLDLIQNIEIENNNVEMRSQEFVNSESENVAECIEINVHGLSEKKVVQSSSYNLNKYVENTEISNTSKSSENPKKTVENVEESNEIKKTEIFGNKSKEYVAKSPEIKTVKSFSNKNIENNLSLNSSPNVDGENKMIDNTTINRSQNVENVEKCSKKKADNSSGINLNHWQEDRVKPKDAKTIPKTRWLVSKEKTLTSNKNKEFKNYKLSNRKRKQGNSGDGGKPAISYKRGCLIVRHKNKDAKDHHSQSYEFSGPPSSEEQQCTSSSPTIKPRPDGPIDNTYLGDFAYAMLDSNDNGDGEQQEFRKCKITEDLNGSMYKIQFESNNTKRKKAVPTFTVAGHHLAFYEPPQKELPIGTRCITAYADEIDKIDRFYPATVVESPTAQNYNQYLIFFDDGHVDYFSKDSLRVIVDQDSDAWKNDHCDPQFIERYLRLYPNNPVLHLAVGDGVEHFLLKTGEWSEARVVEIHASMVKIDYGADWHQDWVYIGRLRRKDVSKLGSYVGLDIEENVKAEQDEIPLEIKVETPEEQADGDGIETLKLK